MSEKVSGGPVRLEQCRGHLRWRHAGRVVHVHQLAVIAQGADPSQVFSGGEWHVHHGNGVRWDNRPSNISLVHGSDHGREDCLPPGPWAENWSELPAVLLR
jgi:hypothetical protein